MRSSDVSVGLAALAGAEPAFAQDGDTISQAFYLVLWLVLLLSSLIAGWRIRGLAALRYAAIWMAIGFVLVVAYAYRPEARQFYERILGALAPAEPIANGDGGISVRMATDGHYHVLGRVNGKQVEMLVDTGASTVVIPAHMARDLGIDLDTLSFDTPFETANGPVMGAMFRIKGLEIGGIVRCNVAASVMPDLEGPLLGMSFFNSLSSFAVSGETLTMKD